MATNSTFSADWNCASRRSWTRLLRDVPYCAFQQDFAYGEMLSRVGVRVHRCLIKKQGTPIAVAQAHTRTFGGLFSLSMVMMGPVWLTDDLSVDDKAEALETLSASIPTGKRSAFLVMPPDADDAPYRALKAPQVVSSYHTALIDLSGDEDAVRSRMTGKWRNRLVAGEKAGLTVARLPTSPEGYRWLLERENQQRKQSKYSGLPVEMVPAFHRVAGTDKVISFAAQMDGKDIAGCLFLRHGRTATYHIGWSGPDGKANHAHNVLLWEAMKTLRAGGTKTLDLGGLVGPRDDGLVRFKLGTGAKPLSQAGIFLMKPEWRSRF